jgi:hypothetical protein
MAGQRGRRHRGLGQVMPTCVYVDETSTIPQMVLAGGGSLAMLVGIIGAVVSDEYKQAFAITAAAGLASSIAAGIWAAANINKNGVLGMGAQCTGPGMPELGLLSVNPDQSTPAGQQPGLFGPTTPTQSVYQATAASPQITNPPLG